MPTPVGKPWCGKDPVGSWPRDRLSLWRTKRLGLTRFVGPKYYDLMSLRGQQGLALQIALAAVVAVESGLAAQGLPEPSQDTLAAAPLVLGIGKTKVSINSCYINVLSDGNQPNPGARVEVDLTLKIEVPISYKVTDLPVTPPTVSADRAWFRSGDSVIEAPVQSSPPLAESEFWSRRLRVTASAPAWLANVDSVDVVLRIVRDSQSLGYVRVPNRLVINPVRAAEAARRAYPTTVRREGASYFAAYMDGEFYVMQGGYRAGQFDTQTVALDAFPPGQALKGIDRSEKTIAFRYDTVPAKDYEGREPWDYTGFRYDSVSSNWVPAREVTCLDSLDRLAELGQFTSDYWKHRGWKVRNECSERIHKDYESEGARDMTLLWLGPVSVRPEQATEVHLEPALRNLLERRGKELWSAGIPEVDPQEDRPTGAHFGLRRDQSVAGAPGMIVSWWQVILSRPSGDDPRGSLFFISSVADRKILYATFGHPEWSPVSDLIGVRPYIYFRIEGEPSVYCLTTYEGAWESSGMALFDISAAHLMSRGWAARRQ